MNRRYFNKKQIKTDMDKIKDFHKVINSITIECKKYREIFDNAVQFEYGESLNEYNENSINAIMVNNIRHDYSNYEQMLKQMHRVNRSKNDYDQYKNFTLNKIAYTYPFLKEECERQKRKFDMVVVCE